MEEQIQEFLAALRNDKGYSPNTIEAYRNDLQQLLNFALNERQYLTQWSRVDKPLLLSFLIHLKDRQYTASSVSRKVAVIKTFFHFLEEKNLVADNPTATLDSPKVVKRIPHVLAPDEVERLLAAPLQNNTPKGLRDRAILELLSASGLRVTELVSLDVEDVNLEGGVVRCVGSGVKRRVIPVEARALEAVAEYLRRARPVFTTNLDERALFVNPHGERLTRQGLWLIIKEYVKTAQITTPVSPHMLRHSFAVHLLSGGTNLQNVQRLLGHTSIATTQVYQRLIEQRALALVPVRATEPAEE
ncbi:MAG: tyrosine recombinase [Chloroflexi bacterium]|nr:tyrosine recombinase [Chloroflexota bacterium]